MSDATVQAAPRRRWRWLRSISIATRLAAAVVTVSIVSLVIATIVGVTAGRDLTDDLTDDRLGALRTTAAADVASEMRSIERTATTMSTSPGVASAIAAYSSAITELDTESVDDIEDDISALFEQYDADYLEAFAEAGVDVVAGDVVDPSNLTALRLQASYSLLGPRQENASTRVDADDSSEWSAVHQNSHPTFRDIVERQELVDLLLVEPDGGTIVYSVAKHPDLGTSLDVGPFSGSVIAGSVDAAREDPSAGPVITDVSIYLPAGLEPVGAVTTPVFDGDDVVGVVVLVYDTAQFTDLLTAGGEWEDAGFPETGETFMIAGDGTLRTEPRSFLQDSAAHLDAAEENESIDDGGRQRIEVAGSTVLVERGSDETLDAGQDGDLSVRGATNVIGSEVFSSAEAVPVEGVEWYVVSEVSREVARGPLEEFAAFLVVGATIFVVLIAFAAVWWSASIVASIREISARLRNWRTSTAEIEISHRSPAEIESLAHSFTAMIESLDQQRDELAEARRKKVELLRSMLPEQVAERVASGELESIEEVPKVSVAVVVVAGLGDLVRIGEGTANRTLLDALIGDLDDLAEQHGLERIKIVGDAYFAVCGHHRPYIDHAPRALAFAADAHDAVREHGADTANGLDVVAGIHTGPVNVGMTHASGLVYDVWGRTVSMAHELARRGSRGDVLVSDTTLALLPESVRSEPLRDDPEVAVVAVESVGGSV